MPAPVRFSHRPQRCGQADLRLQLPHGIRPIPPVLPAPVGAGGQPSHFDMPTAAPASHDAKIEAQVLWFTYRKEIVAILVVLVCAALLVGGYRLFSDRRNAAAAALLATAKAPTDYQRVIERYGNTPAGASAYVLLAAAQRAERKFNESNTTIQQFVQKQPKHALVPSARVMMAANFESLGRNEEALALYQQVSNMFPQSYVASYALISQVRLLKAKGQNDGARQACEKILLEHRDSAWAAEAMHELRVLMPKEQPAIPGVKGPASAGPAGMMGPTAPPLIARPPSGPAPANTLPPPPKPK